MLKELETHNDLIRRTGYLILCPDPRRRLMTERSSLNKLNQRNGYLHRYNYLIRLMLIHYLELGYDIPDNKIHKALQYFLVHQLKLNTCMAQEMITARHKLKYDQKRVDPRISDELNRAISRMENGVAVI